MKKDLHKQYVVGFMFSADLKRVALIRKKRPKWQEGLLNGIGGKRKEGEHPHDSMCREFEEETGLDTNIDEWRSYHKMKGVDSHGDCFEVDALCAIGDIDSLVSKTDEKVVVEYVNTIHPNRADTVDNLCWLVAIASNCLKSNFLNFTESTYG